MKTKLPLSLLVAVSIGCQSQRECEQACEKLWGDEIGSGQCDAAATMAEVFGVTDGAEAITKCVGFCEAIQAGAECVDPGFRSDFVPCTKVQMDMWMACVEEYPCEDDSFDYMDFWSTCAWFGFDP
jgi:hypothetical protein